MRAPAARPAAPCPRTQRRGTHTRLVPAPLPFHLPSLARPYPVPAARDLAWVARAGIRYTCAWALPSLGRRPRHALGRNLALGLSLSPDCPGLLRALQRRFGRWLDGGMLGYPLLGRGQDGGGLLFAEPGYRLEGLEPRARDAHRREEPVLGQTLDHLSAEAREFGERRLTPGPLLLEEPPLFLHLSLALDVDVKPGQFGREPGVLALLADGQRELVVRHDHEDRAGLAALLGRGEGDRGHLGRRERSRHESGGVGRPLHDIDLLAAKLAADDLDARAAEPHAGADGIDVALGGDHRHLGALPRLPRRRLDLHDALGDLGNLRLEKPHEKAGVRAREEDLRPFGRLLDLLHVGAHPVVGVVALAGNLLALGDNRLRLAQVHDHVALLDAVDGAADDLALLVDEVGVDGITLGVADPLQDDLLGRLGGDTTELLRGQLDLDLVLELRLGVQLARLAERDLELGVGDALHDFLAREDPERPRAPIQLHARVVGHPHGLLGGRQEGRLQRLEEDLLVYPLLRRHLADHVDELFVHHGCVRSLPSEWRVQARLGQERPRHLVPSTVGSLDDQPLRRRRLETPREFEPTCHRLAHPAPHVLPDRPDKLPVLPELTVEPGRGHFEVVRLCQKTRHVQHIARFVTEALTIGDARSARLVHEEAQRPAPTLAAPLRVHQLEPVGVQNRRQDSLDLGQERLTVTGHQAHSRFFSPRLVMLVACAIYSALASRLCRSSRRAGHASARTADHFSPRLVMLVACGSSAMPRLEPPPYREQKSGRRPLCQNFSTCSDHPQGRGLTPWPARPLRPGRPRPPAPWQPFGPLVSRDL